MENLLIPYQAETLPTAGNVLVIAPHPDDEVFGCGGAIMRHIQYDDTVHVIILSDGAFGVDGEEKSQIIRQRESESRAAAKLLGYGEPQFWQLPDRGVTYGEALVRRILAEIEKTAATLIYAPSLLEMHPDHRAAAMNAIEAVRRAPSRPDISLYEIGIPLPPNRLVDITDLADRKMAAMQCFVSQNGKQRYDLDIAALNRFRTYTLPAEVTSAEAYLIVSADELCNDPLKLYESEYQRQHRIGLALDTPDVPLVSVIVRSMDRTTLAEALDSIALQTYSNIEVIVVNAKGGRHSPLGETCGRFPLRLINDNNEPLARSAAANEGLDAAQGVYAMFLDDDDFVLPPHINDLAERLSAAPKASAAYSAVQCVDEQKNPLAQQFGKPYEKTRLMSGNFIPIHSVLFKRQHCVNGCRFDEALELFEDWDFWLQLAETGHFEYLPRHTAIYRISSSGGFGVTGGDAGEAIRATRTLVTKWQRRWPPEAIYDLMENNRQNLAALDDLNKMHESNKTLSERLDHSEKEKQRQQQELNRIQTDINALLNSTSWRLTAPLRRIISNLRRL